MSGTSWVAAVVFTALWALADFLAAGQAGSAPEEIKPESVAGFS